MVQARKRPQINFQVEPVMKDLYEEARAQGHWVTRFCAAGLLLMIEDPAMRARAIQRLREWEAAYADASADRIRAFVEGAATAMRLPAPGNRPGPSTRRGKKRTRGPESA